MNEDLQNLKWVTSAKLVGPLLVVILVVGALVAGWFVASERFAEAIITLLFALCLILAGLADLLGELIMLVARNARSNNSTGQAQDS